VNCREVDASIRDFLKADLDDGEAAAIAQAEFTNAILLLDEEKGFRRAIMMQITVVRTLRLLNMLKAAGAIRRVLPYHEKLDKLGFYMTLEDRNQLLAEAGEL
jgi:predicted nucleic acid-binding protein